MDLRNLTNSRLIGSGSRLFLLLIASFLMVQTIMQAQTQYYEITTNQRRMGDTIGVEFWIKSLTSDSPNLGNMSIALTYNRSFLSPANPSDYSLATTDSVGWNVNSTSSSYTTITSPFSNSFTTDYGYSALQAQAGNNGSIYVYQLDVSINLGEEGYQPSTEGRGSFVGMLKFQITEDSNLDCDDLTQVQINEATSIGDFVIFDVEGNDVEDNTTLTQPGDFTIQGITILNPDGKNETVNPSKDYQTLDVKGYPIFYERSGLLTSGSATYGEPELAYSVDYSTDNGSTWQTDEIRFAESSQSFSSASFTKYSSGDIGWVTISSNSFVVTTAAGSTWTSIAGNSNSFTTGYSGVLRFIWQDVYFPHRSEQALLRMTQLDTDNSATITSRSELTGTCYTDVSNDYFDLSRLNFLQLDGATSYLKSEDDYSNATQLTVEAWVNLNSIQSADGAEPGIVAMGPGPNDPAIEGAWLLYLDEGQYPAFRAREIIGGSGRGENGGEYIAAVVSPDILSTTSASFPINENPTHADNWKHIAATVRNNVVKLYVDGELMASKTNNNADDIRMLTAQHPVWVGVNPNGGLDADDYLHAGIKEVRVWRRALTQDSLRKRIAGISSSASTFTEGLEMYYNLDGTKNDKASSGGTTITDQDSNNVIRYYTSSGINSANDDNNINYRPDKGHVTITSPKTCVGVQNLSSSSYTVRWAAFGLGAYDTTGTEDMVIEFSRNSGGNWIIAENTSSTLSVDIEDAEAIWEPYLSSTSVGDTADLKEVVPGADTNYTKDVMLRSRGLTSKAQNNISYTTGSFQVAPYFALKNTGNPIIRIAGTAALNLSTDESFLETWIRPYRFPTADEGFFPIISKKDSTNNNLHYSLRLLNTGQIQLAVGSGSSTMTATSSSDEPLVQPNLEENDSAWTHVGVYTDFMGGNGQSTVKFYIDGKVQAAESITQQFGTDVSVDNANTYPTYIAYEPGTGNHYIGEIKNLRLWNGLPAGQSATGSEPTALTKFIQGALTLRYDDLSNNSSTVTNLAAAFSMNGGSFVYDDFAYNSIISDYPESSQIQAKIERDDGICYKGVKPYLKLVEPQFGDTIPNTTEDLYIRWVGFDYTSASFTSGSSSTASGTFSSNLEYSILGGGGDDDDIPYTATSSSFENTSFTNSATFTDSDSTRLIYNSPSYSQYGAILNVSIADPDDNGDGTTDDQGEIEPALMNGRFRLSGKATINGESASFTEYKHTRTESPLFTITPNHNFTLRVLAEGWHTSGTISTPGTNSEWLDENAFTVKLYQDNGGTPGDFVAQSTNSRTYADLALTSPPSASYANLYFLFPTVDDGQYFAVVEHDNYLPVMSRFAATFSFSGEDTTTTNIESGWDFTSWDGAASNVLTESDAPYVNLTNEYTAYGNLVDAADTSNTDYAAMGLHYNDGTSSTITTASKPAMVAGDVNGDGLINAADRVQVRSEAGSGVWSSDVTGDGEVNAQDRNIVDRNNGLISSLSNLSLGSSNKKSGKSEIMNLAKGGGTKIMSTDGIEYNLTGRFELTDNFINVSFYISNTGKEFALGNCTFAVDFNTQALNFVGMTNADDSPWNNDNESGYSKMYYAPRANFEGGAANVKSVEIDYDFVSHKPGTKVPYEKTLIATLRFSLKSELPENVFDLFKWHNSTVVLDINGRDITDEGILQFGPTPAIIQVPNGGEDWNPGTNYAIKWTKPGFEYPVYLQLSTNAGENWITMNEDPVEVSKLRLDWYARRFNSTQCLVRLIEANTGSEIDRSDDYFTLNTYPVTITRPAADDPIYTGGINDFINWQANETTRVRFKFSPNGETDWQEITNVTRANAEKQAWRLPSVNTKHAVIAMHDAITDELIARSEPFKVLAGTVDLADINAQVNMGMELNLRWSYNNVEQFDMEYTPDGGVTWNELQYDVNAAPQKLKWTVPQSSSTSIIIRALWDRDPEMEYDRTTIITGVDNQDLDGPFTVDEPYPNPFTGKTYVMITLPEGYEIKATLYTASGVKVMDVLNKTMMSSGTHKIEIDGRDLSAGAYILHIFADQRQITKDLILVK